MLNRVTTLLANEHIDLEIDDLRYNLFNLSLRLRNVRVGSTDARDLPPFLTVGVATVRLSLAQLVRGRFVVSDGAAETVALQYLMTVDGRDNLPHAPRDEHPEEPLDYLVESFRIEGSEIHYEDQHRKVSAVLPVRTVTVSGSQQTDRHTIEIDAGEGRVHMDDRDIDIHRLGGEVSASDDDAELSALVVEGTGGRITVDGAIRGFDLPQLDLTFRGQLDAAVVGMLAGIDDVTGGVLDVDGAVRGQMSLPSIAVRVDGSELSGRGLHHVQLTLDGSYDIGAKRGSAKSFEIRGPLGSLSGSGEISALATDPSHVRFESRALDVAALMRAAKLSYIVLARVDASGRAHWPGLEYRKATGTADAVLTPTAQGSRRREIPIAGLLSIAADNGHADMRVRRLTLPGISASGTLSLGAEERLRGVLHSEISSLARAAATADAVAGTGRERLLPVDLGGTAVADVQVSGTTAAPNVAIDLASPGLAVNGVGGIMLDGRVTITPQVATVERLELARSQGRAAVNGRIGITKPQSLDLTLRVDNLTLNDILTLIEQPEIPASGVLSLAGTVGGTVSRPDGSFSLRGTDLVAYEEPLGELTASAILADKALRIADLVLVKPQPDADGHVLASGWYRLDDRSYWFDVSSERLKLTALTLPDGQRLRGDLQLNAQGKGSVDSPAADIQLALAATTLDDSELGPIDVRARITNREAVVDATAAQFGLTTAGTIGMVRPYPARIDATFTDVDLAALPLQLETPLTGLATGTASARGDLIRPQQGEATLTLSGLAGTWRRQPFQLNGPAQMEYAGEVLRINRLQLHAQESSVAVSGTLPLHNGEDTAGGTLDITAHGNLATLARYAPSSMDLTGDGTIDVTGAIRGTLGAVEPDLAVHLDRASLASTTVQPGISNLTATARLTAGAAHLEQLTANWGEARIAGTGIVPFSLIPTLPEFITRANGPARLQLTVQDLDPSTIPGAPEGLTGHITVETDMAADRPALTALAGRIVASQLDLNLNGLTLAQTQPSAIRLADGAATIERFDLSGTVGSIAASGRAGLAGDPLDVHITGYLNAAAVDLFTDAVHLEGTTVLDVAARGSVASPDLQGFVQLADATLVADEPRIAAEQLSARLELAGNRLVLTRIAADVNGGRLEGSGAAAFRERRLSAVDLQFALTDFAFDAPLDLRSISDSNIRITSRDEELVVEGDVTIQEGGLTGDINFDVGLLSAMTARRQLELTESRNPLLARLRFGVNVNTNTPVIVDNNLAQAEVESDLRVLGTFYETGVSGRLTILEGGEVTLNERRYQVDRGEITFVDDRRIYPSFDLRLSTTAGNYDVDISVSGTPDKTETVLTSEPTLPEPDIMALLVTGRTLDEMRGQEYEVAREQVLSYLTGRVGSSLGRQLEKATGLSEVRIEPMLIANEVDPGARFTVGQELTDELKLTYSTNLADSSDQVWVAEYDVTRLFQARAVRQSDNSYRTDFRHDLRFGGRPEPRRLVRERATVVDVAVAGGKAIAETEIRRLFRVEPGDVHDFFAVRKGVERIEEALRDRNYLQSRVRLRRTTRGEGIHLTLEIADGPVVDVQFEGIPPPNRVRDRVRLAWHRGVFDAQRTDDGLEEVRRWLMRSQYLQPTVTCSIEDLQSKDRRRIVFKVESGPRSSRVMLVFRGASAVSPDVLQEIIDDQQLEEQVFSDPFVVTELLRKYYREQGYLSASIDKPRYEFEGQVARIVLEVREGPRFNVRLLTTSGNRAVDMYELLAQTPLEPGQPFLPAAAEAGLHFIRDYYWRLGYNEVQPNYTLAIDRAGGLVDVTIGIAEGQRSIVSEIAVAGNQKTSDRLIHGQLVVETDQPLDLSALSRSRRNLYDTGAYSVVEITRRDGGDTPAAGGETAGTGDKPVTLDVAVREVQPIQVTYGASYDTERGVGGILDVFSHNMLGRARVLGLRSRYDGQVREVRGQLSQPSLLTWPVETIGSLYYRQERTPATGEFAERDVTRKGASIQQTAQLRDSFVFNYGYRYERVRTIQGGLGERIGSQAVAPLTSTLTRDTRDEVWDATRGAFTSHALIYSASWLGADLPFVKYNGQYFRYLKLQPERRKPLTREIIRPRFIYAGGVRVGLSRGLGGPVPSSERFFAGGSTTLRGFAQDAIRGSSDIGGQALLVINNELRFPLVGFVDGVAFVDVGNVFARTSDFSLSLRESAGVGLRLRTPWFLVRGDYGVVLDKRAGEPRHQFFFSIGQAF